MGLIKFIVICFVNFITALRIALFDQAEMVEPTRTVTKDYGFSAQEPSTSIAVGLPQEQPQVLASCMW